MYMPDIQILNALKSTALFPLNQRSVCLKTAQCLGYKHLSN